MNFFADRAMSELLSGLGAGMIGGAIGIYFAHHLRKLMGPVFVLGVLTHSVGMWGTKQIDKSGGEFSPMAKTLYYSCWFLLTMLVVYGVSTLRRKKNQDSS